MGIRTLLTVVALAAMSGRAIAQDDRAATISASVAATSADSHTEASFTGAFGYRFTRVVGLEIEATVVPNLRSRYPDDFVSILSASAASTAVIPLISPPLQFDNPGGRMVILTNNVRVVLPIASTRFEPYFVAGGGIASTRRTAEVVYPSYPPYLVSDLTAIFGAAAAPVPIPSRIYSYPVTTSSVEMALTIGGGLSVRVRRQMTVDADVRMFRLLAQTDRSVGRFGVGVRYRF